MKKQEQKAVLPSIGSRFTDEEVRRVMHECYGNLTGICNALDCSYQQLMVWLRKPEHKEWLEIARSRMADHAESRIMQLLMSDDERVALEASKYVLRSVGRSRGWGGDSPSIDVEFVNKSEDEIRVQVKGLFGIQE